MNWKILLILGVWGQCGMAMDTPSHFPSWKLSFGPCLVGAGDLIGGSMGAGLQWNRGYWGWGFESRFQSVTWVVDAGEAFGQSTPYKIYKQHNGFQQDFEAIARLPLGRFTLFVEGGPSLV